MLGRFVLLAALPLAVAACRGDFERQVGPADRGVFAAPDAVEILALDPGDGTGGQAFPPDVDAFHGFRVLGRARLADPGERAALVDLVRRGIETSDGRVAMCFLPRHGVVLRRGEERLDLVICYECLQLRMYREGAGESGGVRTSDEVEGEVSAVFRAHGLTLAAR